MDTTDEKLIYDICGKMPDCFQVARQPCHYVACLGTVEKIKVKLLDPFEYGLSGIEYHVLGHVLKHHKIYIPYDRLYNSYGYHYHDQLQQYLCLAACYDPVDDLPLYQGIGHIEHINDHYEDHRRAKHIFVLFNEAPYPFEFRHTYQRL
jgi:hypothetical protein